VCGRHGLKGVVPVYIGDDPAFHSIRDIQGGLYILVTGGQGTGVARDGISLGTGIAPGQE
jgi:hypothetical protein